jgi:large subunit ribosomal protein L21
MYAVIKTGGKQYKVSEGDVIEIEKVNEDKKVTFDEVLMAGDKIGAPTVSGAKVEAEVIEQKKAPKILVFKKKRRHNYRRKVGHRQLLTVVKITKITA